MEENDNMNQKNLSELFNSNENLKKSNDFYPSFNDTIENKYNSPFNQKKDDFQKNEIYNKNLLDENHNLDNSLSSISLGKEEFIDDSSLLQLMENNKQKTISLEEMIERINYLIEFYEIKKVNFKNTYIRCFHIEEDKSQSEICNCIPLIEKKSLGLRFSCDGNNFKFFSIEKIIKIILSKKFLWNFQLIKKIK